MSNLDIPAFLKLTSEERKVAWVGHKYTVQGSNFAGQRKDEEPATRKLRLAMQAEQQAKKQAGLARLKEWKEEHK